MDEVQQLREEVSTLRSQLERALHRDSLTRVKADLAAMTDQRDYHLDRANKFEQKMHSVRRSRDEQVQVNAALRARIEDLQTILEAE